MANFDRQWDRDTYRRFSAAGLWLCAVGLLILPGCEPQPVQQKPAVTIPDAQTQRQAIEQIITASKAEDPFLRANAIESAQWLPDRALQLVQLGLTDENPAVRFTAVVMVGKLELPTLVQPVSALRDDPSASVRAGALFALKRCGQQVNLSPMAAMLVQPDATLRSNVAMLMGKLGDDSAIPVLRSLANAPSPRDFSLEQDAIVEVQVAEALVALGYEPGLEVLRASAFSPYYEVRITAVRALGFYSDRKFHTALVNMLGQDPVELRLAAAESLARMGSDQGLVVVLAGSEFDLPPVRAQAALALRLFTDELARQRRNALLSDSSQQVRVAAAAAILAASQNPGPGADQARSAAGE